MTQISDYVVRIHMLPMFDCISCTKPEAMSLGTVKGWTCRRHLH